MTTNEICWIAGLLEGEGYFGFSGGPNIQLTSTDLDTIQKYERIIGAKNNIRTNKQKTSLYKIQYNLNICSILAVQWMMTIYPLMSLRRKEQIKTTLKQWKEMPRTGMNSSTCKNGHLMAGSNLIIELNGRRRCKICRLSARKIHERIRENCVTIIQ